MPEKMILLTTSNDRESPLGSAAEAAKILGKLGGRPRGSLSSPLSVWLRREIAQRQREGYRCRESFEILLDTEKPDGEDAFTLTDYTSDQHDIEPDARVTFNYFRKIWRNIGVHKPVCVPRHPYPL